MTQGETPEQSGIERLAVSSGGRRWLVFVALIALLMGLPTLRGGFVGNDDHRLILNHVLVNHPSFEHAVKLFGIVHRDLYQPVPLLTFSMEFALGHALGLFDRGIEQGEWLFHLTNTLLHMVNAVLVWLLLVRMTERLRTNRAPLKTDGESHDTARHGLFVYAIATIAATLFALHPLQVEVVAWTNGRMMLLSTLFALAAMLALIRWLDGGRWYWAMVTVFLIVLCMASKVRAGIPIMLVLVAFCLCRPLGKRFGSVCIPCSLITGAFILLNIWTTARMELFHSAGENLAGPRVVRVLMTLAWNFQHFLWPSGLSSWYPAPVVVHWTDHKALTSALTVLAVGIIVLLSWRRFPPVLWGMVWFLGTIIDTLPLFPARHLLAADRYMYLPIIGLAWGSAGLILGGYAWIIVRASHLVVRAGAIVFAMGLIFVFLLHGWFLERFYESAALKTARIVDLFPDTPHVWARLGWAYHQEARQEADQGNHDRAKALYLKALECAQRELANPNDHGWSEGLQLSASAHVQLGEIDKGLGYFEEARSRDPDDVEPIFRLADAYYNLGRYEEALTTYEEVYQRAPNYNPSILILAKLYRQFGRNQEARGCYLRAVENNEYEVPAILGLVELDIALGTPESLNSARERLEHLLDWMPENDEALVSLGVVLNRQGKTSESINCYEQVLERNPRRVTAALNLGQIYSGQKADERANYYFDLAAEGKPEILEQAAAIGDHYINTRRPEKAVSLWIDYLNRFPGSLPARVYWAWAYVLSGKLQEARSIVGSLDERLVEYAMIQAVYTYIELVEGSYADAIERVERLNQKGEKYETARKRLLSGLEQFGMNHPDNPWTYYLAAQLMIADGKRPAARVAINLFTERCQSEACSQRAGELRSRLPLPDENNE